MKKNDINQLCNVYDLCKSELIAGCVQANEKDVQEWWKSCQQLLHSEKSDFRTKEKVILMFTRLLAEKSELLEKTEKLETENAELRARLDKTVELPVKIGDTIYEVCKACDAPCECKYYTCAYPEGAECHAPSLPYGYSNDVCFSAEIVNDECKKHLYVEEWKFNLRFLNAQTGRLEPQYFIDREAAEARLKELKEEI